MGGNWGVSKGVRAKMLQLFWNRKSPEITLELN